MRFFNHGILNTAQMTSTTVVSSSAIPLERIEGFSIQAVWQASGSAGVTGSLKLQSSHDVATNPSATTFISLTNWSDVANSTVTISGSNSATRSHTFNVAQAYYPWIRVVYTNTAGSGSMDVRCAGKGA